MTSKKISKTSQLVQAGIVTAAKADQIEKVVDTYSVSISPHVQSTIQSSDLSRDPVGMQYVPNDVELVTRRGESADPIGDEAHTPVRGLVHRYPDRALLKITLVCPVYCRFCFRREMVGGYAEPPLSDKELEAIFDYIESHDEIWEVILSGGDPLILSTRRIQEVLDQLRRIDHVRVVRIHTRVPVVDPDRVDEELIETLSSCEKTVYVVLHANHANEFSDSAKTACRKLIDAGIPMRSQTVLLKGINDTEEALVSLMRTFVINRITPYYLHHLDAAPGTGHFRQSVAKGQELVKRIRGQYSGMCQPTYVLDIPGGYGKSPIGPQYIRADGNRPGAYVVEDYLGTKHFYATDHMVGETS